MILKVSIFSCINSSVGRVSDFQSHKYTFYGYIYEQEVSLYI